MDGLALTVSIGLQYGVPLKVFVDKLVNTRFEPSGITANANIRFRIVRVLDYWRAGSAAASSLSDYLKLNGAAPEVIATAPMQTTLAMPPPIKASEPAGSRSPSNAHEGAPTSANAAC